MLNSKYNNFGFLRLVASLLVFVGHVFQLQENRGQQLNVFDVIYPTVGVSTVGLCIFFFISGFLITNSWVNKPIFWSYLKNRIIRIYPGLIMYYVVLLIFIAPASTDLPVEAYFSQVSIFTRNFYQALTLGTPEIQSLFEHNPFPNRINGSLWTIRTEFSLYIMVAFLSIFSLAYSRKFFWITALTLLYPLCGNIITNQSPVSIIIVFFVLGMLSFIYIEYIKLNRAMFVISMLCLIFIYFITQLQNITGHEIFNPMFSWVAFYIALPYATVYIALSEFKHIQNFERFGDYSYGIYLYHYTIVQTYVCLYGKELNFISLTFFSFITTFMLAFFSWHCVEKIALRYKK